MNRTLLSLAIVKANWEHGKKDYIDNFVPLFATLINKNKYSQINAENLEKLRDDFEEEYGLKLPINAVISIMNRMRKKGLLTKDSGLFSPNFNKITKFDIAKDSQDQSRKFEKVLKELQSFLMEECEQKFEKEEIEQGLIAYLKNHDLKILFAAEAKSVLPEVKISKKLEYLINAFIINSNADDPEIFQFIVDLTIGYALASTILYDEFSSFQGNLKKVNFYLDTPFLLNLLGIHGKYKKILAEELLEMINEQNANLFLLHISELEINSNLNECQTKLDQGENDIAKATLALKNCLIHNITATDLEKIIVSIPATLERHNIKRTDIPHSDNLRKQQIDENKLYDRIITVYRSHKNKELQMDSNQNNTDSNNSQNNEGEKFSDKVINTILRDVQVISAIYKFREGVKPSSIKDSKALFVTTNQALAYASRKFELEDHGPNYCLPACITDVFLGTLIWMQSPAKVTKLNQIKIMADCYAAMQPSEELIKKYIEETEKLKNEATISTDQYYLLRTHRSAMNILEHNTLGDLDEFTSSTPLEILNEIESRIKAQEHEKYVKEKENHIRTKEHLEKIIKDQHLNSENEQQKLTERIEKIYTEGINYKQGINEKAIHLADIISIIFSIIFIVLFILLLITSLLSLFNILNDSQKIISWIGLASITFINIVWGFNVKDAKDRVKKYIAKKILNHLETN